MRCACARKSGQSAGSSVSPSGDGDSSSSSMFRRLEPLSRWDVADGVNITDVCSIVGMLEKIQWNYAAEGRLRDGHEPADPYQGGPAGSPSPVRFACGVARGGHQPPRRKGSVRLESPERRSTWRSVTRDEHER